MKDIQGAAFDLDGTLYPNYQFNTLLLPFIIKEFRLLSAFGRARTIIRKEQTLPDFTPRSGDGFYTYQSELTAKILGANTQLIHNKIETLMYRGWEPLFKKIKLFKGVIETLAALKQAGLKLALMSDFPPKTKLENLGLVNFPGSNTPIWDAVLCSEQCGALKPHSLPFAETSAALSLPPEKILYIGNSRAYDVNGASNAGMKTAWIKNPLFPGKGFKRPKADFVFTNYRQLSNFMLK
ncbi:MAG: HAD family hydrolase [Treponema sp.]|jgi:putative hydrolase of the HAD superfamily|nr:HAD family hydrolase [Treponema sp.]